MVNDKYPKNKTIVRSECKIESGQIHAKSSPLPHLQPWAFNVSYSFYGSWESVSGNSGLELARALCTPLNTALLETAVESNGEVIRDLERENVKFQREKKEPKDLYTHHVVEVLNLLNTNISKGNRDNVRV